MKLCLAAAFVHKIRTVSDTCILFYFIDFNFVLTRCGIVLVLSLYLVCCMVLMSRSDSLFSQKQPNQAASTDTNKPGTDSKTTPLSTPSVSTAPSTPSVPDTPTTDIKPPLGSISADIKDSSTNKDDKVRSLC